MYYKQNGIIKKEKNYVALPMPDDNLVIAIPVKHKAPVKPYLIYDGHQKALLLHGKNKRILLDKLNFEAQDTLKKADFIHIAEIDYQQKQMKRDYEVPVKRIKIFPFLSHNT